MVKITKNILKFRIFVPLVTNNLFWNDKNDHLNKEEENEEDDLQHADEDPTSKKNTA